MELKADVANGKEKKESIRQIKNAEESVEVMKIERENFLKFRARSKMD